jgi:hypothetical protein
MKARILHTQFWIDDFVISQSKDVRLFYNYLLTNPHIGLTGIYKLPKRHSEIESGLSDKEITVVSKVLEDNKKAFFFKGWVYIPKADQYNKYSKGPKTGTAYDKELNSLPTEITEHFDKQYPINRVSRTSDTLRNQNPETISKKSDIGDDEVMKMLSEDEKRI